MQTITIPAKSEFLSQLTKEISYLQKYAQKFTTDQQDIDDLVQDTLVKALRYFQNFKDGSCLQAWLFVMMRNIYINNYRKTVRTRATLNLIEEASTSSFRPLLAQNKGESKFILQDITIAVKKLSEKLYRPFELYVRGYKYCEIAEQTGIPIGTVKTRIHLGRLQLKQLLKDYDYTSK